MMLTSNKLPMREKLVFVQINSLNGRPCNAERHVVRSRAAIGGWSTYASEQSHSPKQRVGMETSPRPSLSLIELRQNDVINIEDWVNEDTERFRVLCTRVGVTVPQTLAKHKIDPFETLAIPYSPFINMLLLNYFKRWTVHYVELDAPATPSAYSSKAWSMVQSSPVALSSHLLLSAVVLQAFAGFSLDSPAILRLKSLTLRLINQAVANAIYADDVLLSILALCNSESFAGGMYEIKLHMGGLQKLVHLRGGLERLSPYTRRTIIYYDKSIALMAHIPQSFSQQTNDVVRGPERMLEINPSIQLQHGFQPFIDDGSIHQIQIKPLLHFQMLSQKIYVAFPSVDWKSVVFDDEWNSTESVLETVTLAAQCTRLNNFQFSKPYDVGESVRLATLRLFYCLRQWCDPAHFRPRRFMDEIDTSLIDHIQTALRTSKIELVLSINEARVFWWIVCVIGCAIFPARDQRLLYPLTFLQRRLGIEEEASSIDILESFFFYRFMFAHQHERLWSWISVHHSDTCPRTAECPQIQFALPGTT